jgi:hypothetical protein
MAHKKLNIDEAKKTLIKLEDAFGAAREQTKGKQRRKALGDAQDWCIYAAPPWTGCADVPGGGALR